MQRRGTIKKFLATLLDFFIPSSCIICNEEIGNELVCNNCLDAVPIPITPLCQICGRPIKKGKTCKFCKWERHFEHGRAWSIFVPPVDAIIHNFKYQKRTNIGILIGRGMANVLKSDFFLKKADALIPVPLFWWRRIRRGYNQSTILTSIVSEETGIKPLNLLIRKRNTKTQTKLTDKQRAKNVFDAFKLNGDEKIRGKTVILIDDVMTTGATMNECARILKLAGAKAVYPLVGAITPN